MAVTRAELASEILAFAWCQFNTPIWEARMKMENFLNEKLGPPMRSCTRGHTCSIEGPCNGLPRGG